ncbi:DUF1045 domain-containing protein [Aliishimia ponticola]|uniref:DUF1045 domain-containing protein n=1 Tax=Aliishimia ponticola TaxID=2499833 RepID=A0A4S4NAS5_9RHOB|nr:DUF1045 domain-containing protein [Aliishimia ponticola]THH35071.1 DUF1045 domain-containing protein [Aliishimia ponticola]
MFKRYAVYFVPDGAWGDAGAQWLGWDNRTGTDRTPTHPVLTDRPRKYGFHATMKPPFRLAAGADAHALADALDTMCRDLTPFALTSLGLAQISRFFALTAPDEQPLLRSVADAAVEQLDPFRAPLNDAELARRRQSRLSERQEAYLDRWGYPYVMEEFKFHLTLTGPVKQDTEAVFELLQERLRPVLRQEMVLDSLSLLGEAEDGRFHQIARFAFGG